MKKIPLLIIFSLTIFGCARMNLNTAGLRTNVQLNPTSEPIKKHFKEEKWNHYFVFQLVPTSEPKIEEMLSSHVASGDKVVGLQVKKQMSFLNGLVCVLVGFIYCPDTLIVEGDVVSKNSFD